MFNSNPSEPPCKASRLTTSDIGFSHFLRRRSSSSWKVAISSASEDVSFSILSVHSRLRTASISSVPYMYGRRPTRDMSSKAATPSCGILICSSCAPMVAITDSIFAMACILSTEFLMAVFFCSTARRTRSLISTLYSCMAGKKFRVWSNAILDTCATDFELASSPMTCSKSDSTFFTTASISLYRRVGSSESSAMDRLWLCPTAPRSSL